MSGIILKFVALLALISSALFPIGTMTAQSIVNCIELESIDSGCRIFELNNATLDVDVAVVMVTTFHFDSIQQADDSAETLALAIDDDQGLIFVQRMPGLSRPYYEAGPYNYEAGLEVMSYIFREDNIVSFWIVVGSNPNFRSEAINAFKLSTGSDRHLSNVGLPRLADLPSGFKTVVQDFSGLPVPSEEAESGNSSASKDEETTRNSSTVTRTTRSSTSGSESRSSASNGSKDLSIQSVSSKDAGTGDGSIYVYIEIENKSDKDYSYVQVDLTCRDIGGAILGTGIANVMGLGRNETTVLTGIVLAVPGCTDIDATINPISD